jgi:hypothetical protein
MTREGFAMNFKRLLLAAALPTALLMTACGGGGDDSLDDRVDLADPKVRLVHAIEGGPNVTLTRDGVAEDNATNVGYRTVSKYDDTETDTATWRVATTNGDTELRELDITAERGDKYTLLAIADGTTPEVLFIEDPFNRTIGSDDAHIRVVHAASNASATDVDVYVTAPSADLATATPRIAGVGFKEVSPATGEDSTDLEPDTYVLRITAAGTKTVVFTAPLTLAASADLLLVVLPDGTGVKVLAAEADADSQAIVLTSQ